MEDFVPLAVPVKGNLTIDDIKTLESVFSDDNISVKIQSTNKDKTKALLVLYLQHVQVYKRIECVDPNWTCEVMSKGTFQTTEGQKTVTKIYVSMRMTIKGVTRENVGEGDDYKSAYSDAIKRVGMLFGIGRWLYDSETVWVPYNEQQDKYRTWTMADVKKHSRAPIAKSAAPKPPPPQTPQAQPSLTKPVGNPAPQSASVLGRITFETGQYTGKTMEEVLKIDSTQDYKYAKWVDAQMNTNAAKVNISQKNYHRYATQEGVFG